jgi:Tol biopolymer transport system component
VLIALMVADAGAGAHSRTGGRIAFAVGESSLPRPSQLGVMDADGKHRRLLGPYEVSAASWSPDGRSIAYVSGNIYVINVDGPPKNHLLVRNAYAAGLDWSPTGRTIAFVRPRSASGVAFDIWTFDLRTHRERRIIRNGAEPSWSSSARKLAFVRGRDIWVVELATRKARRLIRNAAEPAWSPDGRRIAFVHGESQPTSGYVYIARADGTRQRRVVKGRGPVWAPSGREIAFEGERGPGPTITRIRLDGSGRRVLWGCCGPLDWGRAPRSRR